MDMKKQPFSEQLLLTRRMVVSRFGLAFGASLTLVVLLFLNKSLDAPIGKPFLQGLDTASAIVPSELQNDEGMMQGSEEGGVPDKNKNKGIFVVKGRFEQKTHEVNESSVVVKKGDSMGSNLGNFSETVKNGSMHGEEGLRNSSNLNNKVTGNNNVGNFSYNGGLGKASTGEEKASEADHRGNSAEQNKITSSYERCDIFDGKWVRDDSKPYYPAGSCPCIDRDFNCHINGRSDDGYVKWKWQPNGCDIPSLNATDFMERLRGKRLVFVGDSLNRNMWESMVCILRHTVRNKERVYEVSGSTEFKKNGFYAFRFEDYNCSVDFVSSPFLVRESSFNDRNGSFETLRLDLIDRTTSMYHDADVLVFNTGHWWTHEKTSRGEDYYQEGNYVYPKLKVLKAYKRALTTWARWIDKNIDAKRTQVFFRGYSVTHFSGGQWNSGGQCHKETEPIFNESYLEHYPSKMRALEYVIQEMKTPVAYLNISRLTDYRKDGHPSIYRKEYKTAEEQIAAERSQDCSHWCLPGVPDTWNELLYASLLKVGRGSWKN